eukprot:9406589-Heterocapsa_arctica.AAC.1
MLIVVAAALDKGGFRSGFSYVLELKLRHVELNFPIPPALGRCIDKVKAALGRGVGPPDKAPEVLFLDFNFDEAHLDDAGDILGNMDSLLVACGWLLRSAELCGLRCSPRFVEPHGSIFQPAGVDVTLKLPLSKTDQTGIGASRRLACICELDNFGGAPGSR